MSGYTFQRTNIYRHFICFPFMVKFFLLALLLVLSPTVYSQTTTGTDSNGFVYSATSGVITITGYKGTGGVVSIPTTIAGVSGTVTIIGSEAIWYCTNLTSVTIPNSVTSIGSFAFQSCTALTSVTIPSSVTSIGMGAFLACTSMTSIIVSESNTVYSSSPDGFLLDKNQTTIIQCPCGKAGIYIIPSSVTSIAGSAFQCCVNLISVTIPSSVTSIGTQAFSSCNRLTSIIVNGSNTVYSSSPDGVLFDKSQATLFQCPCGKLGGYTIPNSVTSIGSSAFYGCTGLTSVTIPSGVTSIGWSAFSSCNGLISLTIPSTVTSIGNGAFYNCTKLNNVTIPNGVASIGSGAFQNCTGLTSVTIPSSITSISSSAFYGCTGLKSLTIPITVTSIGSSAFQNCTNLTSVTIPNSVTSIGSSAFYGCTNLKSANFMGNSPSMGSSVFASVASGFTVYYFHGATGFAVPTWNGYTSADLGLYSITGSLQMSIYPIGAVIAGAQWQIDGGSWLPSGATVLGLAVGNHTVSFSSATGYGAPVSQTLSVTPNPTTSGTGFYFNQTGNITGTLSTSSGFYYSVSGGLVSIIGYSGTDMALSIPSIITVSGSSLNVTSIGGSAFRNGTSLSSLIIPNSVTGIGSSAFYGCTGLSSVTISGSVTGIGSSTFQSCTGLTSVTIPNSVTSIGSSAFSGCTGLSGVIIPSSVISIGVSAFQSCTSLSSVTIPSSVTDIGVSAFNGCTGLTNVTIPSTVTSIGSNAFLSCSGLISITVSGSNTVYSSSLDGVLFDKAQASLIQYPIGKSESYFIPSTVTNIGSGAFYGCTGLINVMIPNNVTSIGNTAFYMCTKLNTVTIPSSVTSIGSSAFQNCTNLTSVTIPSSISTIASGAFAGCSRMTSVTIPNSVTSIGNQAFCACTNLKNAYCMGNAPSVGSSVFASTASGFTVYYFDGSTGFTSPTWNGYPSVDMGAYSTKPIWLISNTLPYNADLSSTPNHDGVPLLMDYALNLDPTKNQSANIPQPVVSGSQMSLTYYGGSSGVTYSVEVSSDLQTWTTSGVSMSAPDINNFCTATIPLSSNKQFMRLKVTY